MFSISKACTNTLFWLLRHQYSRIPTDAAIQMITGAGVEMLPYQYQMIQWCRNTVDSVEFALLSTQFPSLKGYRLFPWNLLHWNVLMMNPTSGQMNYNLAIAADKSFGGFRRERGVAIPGFFEACLNGVFTPITLRMQRDDTTTSKEAAGIKTGFPLGQACQWVGSPLTHISWHNGIGPSELQLLLRWHNGIGESLYFNCTLQPFQLMFHVNLLVIENEWASSNHMNMSQFVSKGIWS